MGAHLGVVEHETAAAVMAAYRRSREPVLRAHLQAIALLLSGESMATTSRLTTFSERWIRKLVGRWNEAGMAGLGDRRRHNAGAEPLLDEAGLAALAAALEAAPADGGLWSGRQVAAWMSAYLGRAVSPKRGLDYLHRLGFSLQRPRPRHVRSATAEEQAAFKKNFAARWRRRGARPKGGRSSSGPSTSTVSA